MPFADLDLPEELLKALARFDLTTAFPIQSATIADALAGRDVLGKARTGSGKTLAFGLPMLARLAGSDKARPRRPLALVLVPTRELAMQVGDALEPYAHALGLSHRLIAGGLSMSKQIVSLERGVHVLVATPGRLSDLMRRGNVDLSAVTITVLDEADHMAEMGFAEEITQILDTTCADAQRLLFSATLDGVVDTLVARFMTNPVLHDVTDGKDAPSQRHVVLAVPPHEKYRLATRIAARQGRTLCFVRTKLAADRVAADMRAQGVLAVALHGDRAQNERNLAMTEFRAGRLPVLVATDVAARGIHVDAVDLVLQIDPPADYRDYTHRSGRTGRAGADGLAVLLSLPHQRGAVQRLLDNAGIRAEQETFRTIDAKALLRIDEITGAREPVGDPVDEPLPVSRTDRRGAGRPGDRHRARGDRSGSRPAARPAARRDDSLGDRERLTTKERELAQREQALVERERRLAQREADATRPAPRSGAPTHPERASRPPYGAPTHRDPRDAQRTQPDTARPPRAKGGLSRGTPDPRRARTQGHVSATPPRAQIRDDRDGRGRSGPGGRRGRDDREERDTYRGDPQGMRGDHGGHRGSSGDARPPRGRNGTYPRKSEVGREGTRGRSTNSPAARENHTGPRTGTPTKWSNKSEGRRDAGPSRAQRRERGLAPRNSDAAARLGDDFDPARTPRKPRTKKSKDGKGSQATGGGSSRRGKPRVKGPGKKNPSKKPKRN